MKLTANTQTKASKTAYTETSLPMALIRAVFLVYLFLLLVVLPLIFHKGYVDIADTKWKYYKLFTVGYISDYGVMIFPGCAVILIILFVWYAIDKKRNGIPFRKPLITDYFVIGYMIVCCISTILAPVKTVVLEGYPGYYMGLYAQLSFCFLYLFSSWICVNPSEDYGTSEKKSGILDFLYTDKFLERVPYIIIALMMLGSTPVMFIGIENAIGKDVFKMSEISGTEVGLFCTTIGNRGIYAEYITVMLIAGIYIFCYSHKILTIVVSGVWLLLAFMAAICANSAGGIIGVIAVLYVYFVFSLRSTREFVRYMLVIILIGVSFFLTGIIAYDDTGEWVLMTESLLMKAIQNKAWVLFVLVGTVLACIGFAMSVLAKKMKYKENDKRRPIISVILQVIVVILSVLSLLSVFLYIKLNTDGALPYWLPSSDNAYLVFSDTWGSDRLYIWRTILNSFKEVCVDASNLKLFGLGPDNLYILPGMTELGYNVTGTNSIFAYAHNELINIYVNMGLLGLLSYAGIYVIAAIYLVFNRSKLVKTIDPVSPARVLAITGMFGYLAQGFFGYQWICVTTVAFILIGVGVGRYRGNKYHASSR